MKTKFNGILTLLLALIVQVSFAQEKMISGTVSDGTGPLPGVNVLIKGTTTGVETDFDGKFSISAKTGDVLVFSFVGMKTLEKTVSTSSTINIIMTSDNVLDEVVVTALGISREKKSLGYSTQKVEGESVSAVKQDNFVDALSGKVSGVQIKKTNNFGGSTNVVIRGNTSITGSNQALFVVDGVPIDNSTTNSSNQRNGRGGYDYGNAASDINPEDIESINVLKGAAASVLYGSRAANGVVLITTKKGKRNKGVGISVQSGLTFGKYDKNTFIKYQKKYGAGYFYGWYDSTDPLGFYEADIDGDGTIDLIPPTEEDGSYGVTPFDPNLMVYNWDSFVPEHPNFGKKTPWVAGATDPGSFFETQLTMNNSISFSNSSDKSTYRISFNRLDTKGILPNSELKRNSVSFNGTTDFNDNLHGSVSANYSYTTTIGRNSTGYGGNLMGNFRQWWQTNVNFKDLEYIYKKTGKNYTWNQTDPRSGNLFPKYWNNPYWDRYENYQNDNRNRFFGNASITYDITDWLSATGKVSIDTYTTTQEERRAVGSNAQEFGLLLQDETSGYQRYDRTYREYNYDATLNFNKNISERFSISGILGTNIRRQTVSSLRQSTNGGLVVPELYALSNSVNSNPTPAEYLGIKQINGYYINTSLSLDDTYFLDLSDRYDVSSTLPTDDNGFNYWSASGSILFSKFIKADWLNFGKLRLGYAEVGNDAPIYSVYNTYVKPENFGDATLFSASSTKNNADLKPEKSKSYEIGIETKMFSNRLGLDLSVYKTSTFNQLLPSQSTAASGYTSRWINAGEVENKGIEVGLNVIPVKNNDFEWGINVNWSKNKNEVKELFINPATGEPVTELLLNSYQGSIQSVAKVGEPLGVLKGTDFEYLNGQRVVDANGYYKAVTNKIIADPNPDWIAGINNTFRYKNLSFGFLVDMSQGGEVYSLDMHYGQGTGLTENTAGLNDLGNPFRNPLSQGGGIILPGVKEDGTPNDIRARADYYGGVFYWGNDTRNPSKLTVYDASFIKLREVSLKYKFPNKFLNNTFIQDLTFSFVGNNLWIIDKNVPYADPESGLSSGTSQGYLSGSYPTIKTYGFNVKVDF